MYSKPMPPAPGDRDARRLAVSEAVWRVLAAQGFGGLRLRAVAAEMGASTGLLTHYFPSKRALLAYALDLLEQRTVADRPEQSAEKGVAALRAEILRALPLDEESAADNRIWVGSWDVALSDPELGAEHDRRYRQGLERLRSLVESAQALGELPAHCAPEDVASSVQGFCLGLVVQALLSPERYPARRQIRLVEDYLSSLAQMK